jgi:hypothetical protein
LYQERRSSPDARAGSEPRKDETDTVPRFAVFIHDPTTVEEFIGLARIDTEADDEDGACERAVTLHSEFARAPFTRGDVALCARLPETDLSHPATARTLPRWF